MPLHKFGPGDVFYNRLNTHPSSSFYIYANRVYYQNTVPDQYFANDGSGGVFGTNVFVAREFQGTDLGNGLTGPGNLFLTELNIARDSLDTEVGRVIGPSSSVAYKNVQDVRTIYPFIYKKKGGDLNELSFKGIGDETYEFAYEPGDVISGSYPLSASLTRRRYIQEATFTDQKLNSNFNDANPDGSALRNSLDFAKKFGDHYNFPSGSTVDTNVIYIPSMFYGSQIKKGSVDLKYYITGSLIARCKDSRFNGALVATYEDCTPALTTGVKEGEILGVVLYNEGVILLTSSANLVDAPTQPPNEKGLGGGNNVISPSSPSSGIVNWNYFGQGLGANLRADLEGMSQAGSNKSFNLSASFGIDFAGTHKIPTITMLANANRGELNYSNNPTYVEFGQTTISPATSSTFYGEQALNIKNIHSSSYYDPTGSLKKTTYITKIGIYDDNRKLIGVASVAKPVKKTEERDLTFKLKLDI